MRSDPAPGDRHDVSRARRLALPLTAAAASALLLTGCVDQTAEQQDDQLQEQEIDVQSPRPVDELQPVESGDDGAADLPGPSSAPSLDAEVPDPAGTDGDGAQEGDAE